MTLTIRGRVQGGRLLVDEPVDLPDGSEVELAVIDDGDDLDEEDRAQLHEAIRLAQAEMDEGKGIPANEVLAALRAKHG
jgi:hypothetical protein